MHLISLPVAMAARQLLVPTFPASLPPSTTGIITDLPVPALETEPPLMFGPGPVIISFETAIASMKPVECHFTFEHDSVVVTQPALMTLTASSTFALAVETSLPKGCNSNSARTISAIDAYPRHSVGLPVDCHDDSTGYIYFTVESPDGSPALDSKGEMALYYVKTQWLLSYPDILREALFNDPDISSTCPNGHCLSTTIPGTDLRLKYVRNPRAFRAGWHEGRCGYLDGMQHFGRLAVPLGDYGYLFAGAVPEIHVVDFVEQQILTTYPVLEISLIAGFTAGLFSLFVVFVPVATYGYFLLGDLYWKISRVTKKLAKGTGKTFRRTLSILSDGVKRCRMKIQQVFGSTRQKEHVQTYDNTDSNLEPVRVRVMNAPPPAYTLVAPTRVFVTLELEDSREYSERPY